MYCQMQTERGYFAVHKDGKASHPFLVSHIYKKAVTIIELDTIACFFIIKCFCIFDVREVRPALLTYVNLTVLKPNVLNA